ncbi:MAG: hypothetical protein M9945_14270 [Aquamicrobium sp.]|uniref:hypothetical protein n=1 Tax=Aquamicrobium sp. TaxID=1872579 RepID=UPI00349EA3EA|nr:hypothetical protein [Aquamicrobium sp.]
MSPRAVIYGLLLLASVLAISWTVHTLREGARLEAIQDVEDANRKSEGMAAGGQADVDRCHGAGGRWDRARGVCDDAAGQ